MGVESITSIIYFVCMIFVGIGAYYFLANYSKNNSNEFNEMIETANDKLKLSKDVAATIERASQSPMALIDQKQNILWKNKSFEKNFGEELNWKKIQKNDLIELSTRTNLENVYKLKYSDQKYHIDSHLQKNDNTVKKLIELTPLYISTNQKNQLIDFNILFDDVFEKAGPYLDYVYLSLKSSVDFPVFSNKNIGRLESTILETLKLINTLSKESDRKQYLDVSYYPSESGIGITFKIKDFNENNYRGEYLRAFYKGLKNLENLLSEQRGRTIISLNNGSFISIEISMNYLTEKVTEKNIRDRVSAPNQSKYQMGS